MDAPRRTRNRKKIIAAAVAAAAAAAIGVGVASAASGAQQTASSLAAANSSQIGTVKDAFRQAISADLGSWAPPSSFVGSKASAPLGRTDATRLAAQPDATVRSKQLHDGLANLSKYFTASQAKHEAIGLQNAVNEEASGNDRILTRGVSKIVFSGVALSGDKASVQAQVSVDGKTQTKMPDGTWNTIDPHNVMAYTATLVKDSTGNWVVSSMAGDFVPGEGP